MTGKGTWDADRLRRVWDTFAPRYDRSVAFLERRWLGRMRTELLGAAATGGAVLEVAIGTGVNLGHYPSGVAVTGVDLSPAMLDRARRRAESLGVAVELRTGDAEALPFSDGAYDTVVCTLGLCGVPDERRAIGELIRVLRPGGRLLLLDHVASQHSLVRLGERALEPLSVRKLGDHLTRRPLPLVEGAGLTIERSERRAFGILESVVARKP